MPFTWQAVYKDGEVVDEYDDDGLPRSTNSLDRDRLERFALLDESDNERAVMKFVPGEKFLYRRRSRVAPGLGTRVCHVIAKVFGGDHEAWFIFEDGERRKGRFLTIPDGPTENIERARQLGWQCWPQPLPFETWLFGFQEIQEQEKRRLGAKSPA